MLNSVEHEKKFYKLGAWSAFLKKCDMRIASIELKNMSAQLAKNSEVIISINSLFSNVYVYKRLITAHDLSLSTSHRLDMTKTLIKRFKSANYPSIHPSF